MLIKAIDYMGNKILRAYKNGIIVWRSSEFMYLALKKTTVSLTSFLNLYSDSAAYQGKINLKIKQPSIANLYSVNSGVLVIKDIKVKAIDRQKISLDQSGPLILWEQIKAKDLQPLFSSNAPYIFLKNQISQAKCSQFIFSVDKAEKIKISCAIKKDALLQLHASSSSRGYLVENIALKERIFLISALSKELKSFRKIFTTFFIKANSSISKEVLSLIRISFLQYEKIKMGITNLVKIKVGLCNNISVLLKNDSSIVTYCLRRINKYFNNFLRIGFTDRTLNFFHIRGKFSFQTELLSIISEYFLINKKILFSEEIYLNTKSSSNLESFLNVNIKESVKFKITSLEQMAALSKVQIGIVKNKINSNASKTLKLFNIIERDKVNATFMMSLIQYLKEEIKMSLNIMNIFYGQQVRQFYITNNFLINYDIKYFNNKVKYPNLSYKGATEYFNSLMSFRTFDLSKLINLKTSQFAKFYLIDSQYLQIAGPHFSEIKLVNLTEGVKNQVTLDSSLFVFNWKIVLEKSNSKGCLLSFRNKTRIFSKIKLSAILASFSAYSRQKTSVFLQIFLHELFNEKAIGKILDINYSLLNFIGVKSSFFVKVIGKVEPKISLKFFNNLPSLYSIQKICHFLEIQKAALLKDQIYFLEKESFFLDPIFQLSFYSNIKFGRNIEKHIYSNLALDEWKYPEWNEEFDSLSIEQVFNFSYKTGEIK